MPRIELIDPVFYNPDDPYHWVYDNLPLQSIIQRQVLINLSLDNVIEQMTDAVGTQNTVANRLNQSINPDGSLKTSAIDEAEHSIESHTDTANYVRMSKAQSDKLDLIADEANKLAVDVQLDEDGNNIVTFDAGTLQLVPSSTVSLNIEAPNKLSWNLAFPANAAHRHYYDQTPVHENPSSPNYIQYKVNSIASSFIEGSLRVYVNGVRLSATDEVYVPGDNNVWTLLSYTPDYTNGRFYFSSAVQTTDIVRIDYDTAFV